MVTSSTLLGLAAAGGVHEALVERQVLDPAGAFLAVDDLGEEVRVAPLGVHVRHRQEAVEVVEADVLGLRLDVLTHVPLADRLGDVAGVGERWGRVTSPVEATGLAVHRGAQQPVAHREAAGHQRRPRRGARRLGVARRQQQAAPGQPVDVGGGRADGHAAAVAAEVAPADVVEQDDQDVRAPAAGPVRIERGGCSLAPGRRARNAARGCPLSRAVSATTGSCAMDLLLASRVRPCGCTRSRRQPRLDGARAQPRAQDAPSERSLVAHGAASPGQKSPVVTSWW